VDWDLARLRIDRRILARGTIPVLASVTFAVLGPAANAGAKPAGAKPAPSSGGNTIETVAGTGVPGPSGDGLPAVQAQLHSPTGVAADMAGSLYIADSANNRIRKVSNPTTPNQDVINTVAGIGQAGFSGDGGPAVDAELQNPTSVAVDSLGDILIADSGNNRVRKVSPAGTITTLAGNGTCSSSAATLASLCHPFGVAADAHGNVYITDLDHFEVKVVDAQGNIHIFAGTGSPGYSGDGGPATSARLGLPTGIALDSIGDVFIADSLDQVVREVPPSGMIETFAGTGKLGFSGDGHRADKARLAIPTGVGTDGFGNVFIADTLNNRIREVADGMITTVAGTGTFGFSGDGLPAATAELGLPIGSPAVIGTDVYFSDTANQRVRGIFMGPPPVLPETAFVFLLPVIAIAAGGGVLYWWRRRARPSSVGQ
jgi:hypothetical protein